MIFATDQAARAGEASQPVHEAVAPERGAREVDPIDSDGLGVEVTKQKRPTLRVGGDVLGVRIEHSGQGSAIPGHQRLEELGRAPYSEGPELALRAFRWIDRVDGRATQFPALHDLVGRSTTARTAAWTCWIALVSCVGWRSWCAAAATSGASTARPSVRPRADARSRGSPGISTRRRGSGVAT